MQNLPALFGIIGSVSIGVLSPGPSFVMVAKASVGSSRSDGLAAAVGIGAGGLALAGAALFGLRELFISAPSLYFALKLIGGIYLLYLGWQIWRGAKTSISISQERADCVGSNPRTFLYAFATQISNPKAVVTYASIFSAFLPPHRTVAFDLVLLCSLLTIETSWYCAVALLLSSSRLRISYLIIKPVIVCMAGAVMLVIGISLVWSTIF